MHTVLCSVDWEKIGRILSASLPLVIAAVATGIAFQQYVTNRRLYRLALFERRMKVFNSTMEFIATVLRDGRVEIGQLTSFWRDTKEHGFLFGPDVHNYIEELHKKGGELHVLGATATGIPANPQRNTELMDWFSDQIKTAPTEKFLKYLDFRKP